MTHPYLEISYRGGKPYLGYLYLKRRASVAKSTRIGQLVIDLDGEGKVIGIELFAFDAATIAALQSELRQRGVTNVTESELRPLIAA